MRIALFVRKTIFSFVPHRAIILHLETHPLQGGESLPWAYRRDTTVPWAKTRECTNVSPPPKHGGARLWSTQYSTLCFCILLGVASFSLLRFRYYFFDSDTDYPYKDLTLSDRMDISTIKFLACLLTQITCSNKKHHFSFGLRESKTRKLMELRFP